MTSPAPSLLEPMMPAVFSVVARTEETADTITLRVQPQASGTTAFGPGQFSMLYAFGVGEVPISISGDPGFAGFLEYTIRSVGAVTKALSALEQGDPLGVRGPYGVGWPIDRASGRDLLIIAGGIGLAPLRPVVLHVLANRSRFNSVHIDACLQTTARVI